MLKGSIEYQRTLFEAGYNTMVIVQGQAEQYATKFWPGSPKKNKSNSLETIIFEFKKEREKYKEMVDDGFDKLKEFFTP